MVLPTWPWFRLVKYHSELSEIQNVRVFSQHCINTIGLLHDMLSIQGLVSHRCSAKQPLLWVLGSPYCMYSLCAFVIFCFWCAMSRKYCNLIPHGFLFRMDKIQAFGKQSIANVPACYACFSPKPTSSDWHLDFQCRQAGISRLEASMSASQIDNGKWMCLFLPHPSCEKKSVMCQYVLWSLIWW